MPAAFEESRVGEDDRVSGLTADAASLSGFEAMREIRPGVVDDADEEEEGMLID